jgi:hypothetical protein
VGRVGASIQGIKGLRGGGGVTWSRHTFSLARLEPTRTGVGCRVESPGATMYRVVGVRKNQRLEGGGRWRGESEIR